MAHGLYPPCLVAVRRPSCAVSWLVSLLAVQVGRVDKVVTASNRFSSGRPCMSAPAEGVSTWTNRSSDSQLPHHLGSLSMYFATRFVPDARREGVWRHLASYLKRWLPAEGALLDLGAGYADLANAAPCARRVAFDLRPDLGDYTATGVEAEIGDVTDLSRFADATFDAVFASNLLEHLDWPQLERCVDEVVRVLKPGGNFIAVQPNFRLNPGRYFDDFTHRTIFTDESLPDFLASRGLAPEHCEARFLPLTMKSRLSFGHRLVPLYLRLPWRPLAGQMLVVARHT